MPLPPPTWAPARHRTGDGERPEPTTATGLVDPADRPFAVVNGVVDPGAKAGRAELEGHRSPWPKSHRGNVSTLQHLADILQSKGAGNFVAIFFRMMSV